MEGWQKIQWKDDRQYNGGMTDNTMEGWQTIQWQSLIVQEVISIKLWPLNFEKSLKIPKSNQILYIEEEQQNGQTTSTKGKTTIYKT